MAIIVEKMIGEIFFDNLVSFFFGKGADSVWSRIGTIKDVHQLKNQIKDIEIRFYEEYQREVHPEPDDEIDFRKLNKFLKDNWDEHISLIFYGGDEAGYVREELYGRAFTKAEANSQVKKRMIMKYIDTIIDVSKKLTLSQVDKSQLFLVKRSEQEIKDFVRRENKKLHDHIDYKNSFAEFLDNIGEPIGGKKRYHYLNKNIGFFGRTKDLLYLDEFLDESDPFLFTVITGPGGTGKSKLLYQYLKLNEHNPEWKIIFLDHYNVKKAAKNFSEYEYRKNIMLIIDYAGSEPETVGELMCNLIRANHVAGKVRMVLLERAEKANEIRPYWYKKLDEDDKLNDYLYKGQFYKLGYMDKDSLFQLMDNISGKKRILSRDIKEQIYNRVIEIIDGQDEGSPLYTILVTDAFLSNQSLKIMNKENLLQYVIKKDKQYWKDTICQNDEKMYSSFGQILMYATVVDGWDFSELPVPLDRDSKYIVEKCNGSRENIQRLFADFLNEKDGQVILGPLEPDVIGEYYALDCLSDISNSENFDNLISLFCGSHMSYMYFLYRCVSDYLWKPEYEKLILGEHSILNGSSPYIKAIISSMLLAYQKDVGYMNRTIKELKELWEKTGKEEISVAYVQGLVNLSSKQSPKEAEGTIEKLKELWKKTGKEEVAVEYAQGLVILGYKQSPEEAEDTIEKLKELWEKTGKEEVALVYARGLVILGYKQSLKEAEDTIEKLKELWEKTGKEEVAVEYAQGLANLSCDQSLEEAEGTIEKLKKLWEKIGKEEAAVVYAQGLVNLSHKQSLKEAEGTIEKLKELWEKTEKEEVALEYAKGFVNLSHKQSPKEAEGTIEKLKELWEKTGKEEISVLYVCAS